VKVEARNGLRETHRYRSLSATWVQARFSLWVNRCDGRGNIWTSTGRGVRCYAGNGKHIGTVKVPEMVSNVCFGSLERNRLFITAQTLLYSVFLNTTGAAAISK
jgi:SMP-30/Gluconolactonase/LRE-like region